jgi:hypothetical protein
MHCASLSAIFPPIGYVHLITQEDDPAISSKTTKQEQNGDVEENELCVYLDRASFIQSWQLGVFCHGS